MRKTLANALLVGCLLVAVAFGYKAKAQGFERYSDEDIERVLTNLPPAFTFSAGMYPIVGEPGAGICFINTERTETPGFCIEVYELRTVIDAALRAQVLYDALPDEDEQAF